ncbi:hypothetical protein Lal_00019124 [Lupinus albus]|nr:hypothetical protein Lal_00019124 [Lupinus albus]
MGETSKEGKEPKEAFEKLEKVGEGTYGKVYRARDKPLVKSSLLRKLVFPKTMKVSLPPLFVKSQFFVCSQTIHISLMDVKQGQNKEGKTVLYLVFEYMDTDLMIFHSIFLCDWAKYSSSNRQKLDVPTMQGCCFLPWSWNLAQDSLEHSLFRLRNTLEILTLWYRAPEVLLGATHYSMPVQMMKYEPASRISAKKAMEHAYFDDLDKTYL